MNPRTSVERFGAVTLLALALVAPAVADAPAPPWITQDIGKSSRPGSTQISASGQWTMQGSGPTTPNLDRYHAAYQPVKGNATLTARFHSMQGTSGGAGAVGLMVRENDQPGSLKFEYLMTGYNSGGMARFRERQDERFLGHGGPSNGPQPVFMRVQRLGSEISGFYSRDGLVWFHDMDPVHLPALPEEALIGLLARTNGQGRFTARFSQVAIQPGAVLIPWIRSAARTRSVVLEWRPLPNALGYHIYRTAPGATANQFARLNPELVTGTTFTDVGGGLVNGVQVTYAVAAVLPGADGTPVEGPLVAVPATPGPVPANFVGSSILEGPRTGSVVYDSLGGVVVRRGTGFGIELSGDGLYFLNQPVEGDSQVTVRMLSRPVGGSYWEEAGLMIRESLDASARHVTIGYREKNSDAVGLIRSVRTTAYGLTSKRLLKGRSLLPAVIVLRLTRQGNTVTPEYSFDDGRTFTAGSAVTFNPPLAQTVYVGLAVTSGRAGLGSRSSFSTVLFDTPRIKKL